MFRPMLRLSSSRFRLAPAASTLLLVSAFTFGVGGIAQAISFSPDEPPKSSTVPQEEDLSKFTGILIDARHLPRVKRSPAPAIYGPVPGSALLYPDRANVPTPDEVQDESIVRYYHTEAEAGKGVCGENPLILKAEEVVGPAEDAVRLNEADMRRLQALENRLHFTKTWKVGFLIPLDR